MKKCKVAVSLLTALVLVFSLLTGCTGKQNEPEKPDGTTAQTTQQETEKPKEIGTIKLVIPMWGQQVSS
jgi:outer membrane biogenesis lipoprotein LolB